VVFILCTNISNHFLTIRNVSFLGPKIQSYFALISAHINNAQIIMTCPSFDKSWLYRELDKFYMRKSDIIGYYLATVLQVFSDSADLAQFLPLICHQVPLASSFWFLTRVWRHHLILQILCEICCLSVIKHW